MRRWLALFLLLAVLVGAVLWSLPRLIDVGVDRLGLLLADALHMPVRIEGVEIDGWPLRVRVERLQFGEDATPALLVSEADVSVRAFESLRTLEPVVSGTVQSVIVDVPRWPESEDEKSGGEEGIGGMFPLFPLRVERVDVGEVRVVAPSGEAPIEINATEVGAEGALEKAALPADISAAALNVKRGDGIDLRATDVKVRGAIEPDGLTIEAAQLNGDFGTVEAKAAARRDLRLDASVDVARLLEQIGVDAEVAGHASVQGSVRGDLLEPTVEAEVAVDRPVVERLEGQRATASAKIDAQGLEIQGAHWEGSGIDVRGTGSLTFDGPLPFNVQVSGTADDLASIGTAIGVSDLEGAGQLDATLGGTLSPLGLGKGYVTAKGADVRRSGSQKGLQIAAEASVECGEPVAADRPAAVSPALLCRGGQLEASVDLGSGNRATATLALAGDDGLQGEARIEIGAAQALSPVFPGFAAGTANLRADVGGTLSEPTARGTLDARGLVIASTRIDTMSGGFALDSRALRLEAISLKGLGGRGTVDGRIALAAAEPSRFEATASAIDLESVWLVAHSVGVSLPYMKGTLNGRGRADGTWEALSAEAEIGLVPLVIETERFTEVRAGATLRDDTWLAHVTAHRREDETLAVEAEGSGLQARTLTVRSSPWGLSGFGFWRKSLDELGGTIELHADLHGDLRHPLGDAEVLLSEVAANGRDVGSMQIVVEGNPKGWSLRAGAPGSRAVSSSGEGSPGPVAITASVTDAAGYPFEAQVELQSFDLAALAASGTGPQVEADATLNASGRLSDISASLRLELVAPRLDVVRDEVLLHTATPIRIHGRGGHFEIESATLTGDLGTASAEGATDIGGRTNLILHIDTKAQILELAPGVTSAAGRLTGDIRVTRDSTGELRLQGDGQATDLALDVGISLGLTHGQVRITFDGETIHFAQAEGKVGGGEVSLSGSVDLASGPSLHWQFADVSTGLVRDLDDRLSGEGDLGGTWERPRLSGTINILSALYDRGIQLQDLIPSFQRQVAEAPREAGTPVDLDLRIVASDGIYLDTPFARAELSSNLRVQGTTAAPRVGGRVEVLSGQVLVGHSTMEVVEGVIDFNDRPKINPDLRFTATATVVSSESAYDVTARVIGTLAEPRVLLSSDDPGLTQNDIFSLMTFGRTSTEMRAAGGGVALGDVLSLAPTLYSRQVSRDIAGALPVDRVEFEPTFSSVTGSFEPRVSVGKDLTERLSATVSSTFAERQLYSAGLEYHLTPRTRIFGLWESGTTDSNEGAFGGGFSFKQEFRDLPCFSLWHVCARRAGGQK